MRKILGCCFGVGVGNGDDDDDDGGVVAILFLCFVSNAMRIVFRDVRMLRERTAFMHYVCQ